MRRNATIRGDVLIFAIALALRLLYVLSIREAHFFEHLQTNALRYHQWATLILDGPKAPLPPFEQAPGYPYLVAVIYAAFGRGIIAVALVQALLGALTCVLIAVAGRRWFGERTGFVAGLLAALYGPLIYFAGELLPATPFVFIVMAAVTAALVRQPGRPSDAAAGTSAGHASPAPRTDSKTASPAWSLAGCLWTTALLVRAEVVLAYPLVLHDAWRRGGRRGLWRTAMPIALALLLCLGANAAYSRTLVLLTTSGGLNLWIGNNPHADGVNPFVFGPLEAVAKRINATTSEPAQGDREFMRLALSFCREHPRQAAGLLWKKLVWTWTDRELPNNSDIDWQVSHSWLYRRPIFPLSFGMILPLAVVGALLLGREWRRLALLLGPLAIGLGTCVLFFTNARFRLIMAPSVLLLAAVALTRLPPMLRAWRANRRALIVVGLGVSAGSIAAWGDFYNLRAYRIPQIAVNTGALEREAGRFDAAVHYLRAGLAQDPHDAIGWIHLALALEQRGDVRASLQSYLDALALMPTDRSLQQRTRRFFQHHGLDLGLLETYLNAPELALRDAATHEMFRVLTADSFHE